MGTITKNLIQYVGIADEFPENPMYFKEVSIPETVKIPPQKPDIEQLLSVMVEAEVISIRLVETEQGTSDEGQNLSGCKLVAELKLRQKVRYVGDMPSQPVHVAEYDNLLKSIFIVIPCSIDGIEICEFFRRNRVVVTPYIEDIFAQAIDCRTVFKNTTLLLDVTFKTINNNNGPE